jgi:ATP-dependent DNA helicase PIF1
MTEANTAPTAGREGETTTTVMAAEGDRGGQSLPPREPCSDDEASSSRDLSAQQRRAVDLALRGRNVFITGGGGVGKSVAVRHLVSALRAAGRRVRVAGSTGIAAVHVGGVTLHALLRCGLAEGSPAEIAASMEHRREPASAWRAMQVLVIDEISMLDPVFFDKCDRVARILRRRPQAPFGGIQVVLVGDFCQLPPVKRATASPSPERDVRRAAGGGRSRVDDPTLEFCFELPLWAELDLAVVELTEPFRQRDPVLADALGRMRLGDHTEDDLALFRARVGVSLGGGDKGRVRGEGEGGGGGGGDAAPTIVPTRLFARCASVDHTNAARLRALPGDACTFHAHFRIAVERGVHETPAVRRRLEASRLHLLRNCPAEQQLHLKLGAQVLLVANLDLAAGLVNGARGVVVGFGERDGRPHPHPHCPGQGQEGHPPPFPPLPVVRFVSGLEREIGYHRWSVSEPGAGLVECFQVPLRLAWAITIHRAQGMTLDCVEISMRDVFEDGMAYVALSRISALDGLSLLDFNAQCIRAHAKAVYFYRHGHYAPFCVVPVVPPALPARTADTDDDAGERQRAAGGRGSGSVPAVCREAPPPPATTPVKRALAAVAAATRQRVK